MFGRQLFGLNLRVLRGWEPPKMKLLNCST